MTACVYEKYSTTALDFKLCLEYYVDSQHTFHALIQHFLNITH